MVLKELKKAAEEVFEEIQLASKTGEPWNPPRGDEVNSSDALRVAKVFIKLIRATTK